MCHHLLKIFGGWHGRQLPDSTVIWTSPQRQTYTTHAGSRILFPSPCKPTAPVTVVHSAAPHPDSAARGLAMPRRTTTRAQNRTQAINEERARNRQPREHPGNDGDETYFRFGPVRPLRQRRLRRRAHLRQ